MNDPRSWSRTSLAQVEDTIAVDQIFARAHLDDRLTFVIRRHFGFDHDAMTLHELGEHLGVTRERIRQMEAKALRKMRQGIYFSPKEPPPPTWQPYVREVEPPQFPPQTPQPPPAWWQPIDIDEIHFQAVQLRQLRQLRQTQQSLDNGIPACARTGLRAGDLALTCDGCKFNFVSSMQHNGGEPASHQVEKLRSMAAAFGWLITDDGDRCPKCQPKCGICKFNWRMGGNCPICARRALEGK